MNAPVPSRTHSSMGGFIQNHGSVNRLYFDCFLVSVLTLELFPGCQDHASKRVPDVSPVGRTEVQGQPAPDSRVFSLHSCVGISTGLSALLKSCILPVSYSLSGLCINTSLCLYHTLPTSWLTLIHPKMMCQFS